MSKIPLEILALDQSISQPGRFVLVLENKQRKYRMPIIMGEFEAQEIALALEQVKMERPQSHDFYFSILEVAEIKIKEVLIEDVKEDSFWARVFIEQGSKKWSQIARPSDAIALALRAECGIYTQEWILDQAGLYEDARESLNGLSKEDLKKTLQEALQNENFELAKRIQSELARRK